MAEERKKIKIICRAEGEVCLLGGEPDSGSEMSFAKRFFESFDPKALTEALSRRCGEDAVVVFRTDEQQMAEFSEAVNAHGGFAKTS